MQHVSSVISGSASLVTPQSSAGTSLGKTGSVNSLVESARDRLLAQASPAATDLALQTSLQSQHNVVATVRVETRYPVTGGFYSVPVGCDLSGEPRELAAAIRKVELAMTPMDRDGAEELIAMLQVATASGKRSADGAELALDLYASNLTRFPADVAKAACEQAAKGKGGTAWFPTLAELIHACETMASPRQQLLAALQSYEPMPRSDTPQTARDWLYAAAQAEAQLRGYPKPDPDTQSELAEFITTARANAKALRRGESA